MSSMKRRQGLKRQRGSRGVRTATASSHTNQLQEVLNLASQPPLPGSGWCQCLRNACRQKDRSEQPHVVPLYIN